MAIPSYDERSVSPVRDTFTGMEALAQQAGASAVLTFTFTSEVDLIWVRSDGSGSSMATTTQTPTSTLGAVCEDGVPTPLTVRTSTVQVWAPSGVTVSVWGFR